MAWIESHQDIGQHPKTYALATALNVDITTAVGVLHLLWHFALKFAWRTGNLSKFEPVAIAHGISWKGDPVVLIKALQKTGWLDKMVVHDWMDYAGKIVRDRLYNEERRNTSSNGDKSRKITATVPDLTVPDLTLPNHKKSKNLSFLKPSVEEVTAYGVFIGFKIDGHAFCDFYESKGWKVGQTPMKDWKAAVRTWKKRDSAPRQSEVIAAQPGISLRPGQDPWKDAFEKSEREGVCK